MKFKCAAPLLAAVTLLLSSCASFLGPREVEFPLAKLQDSVNRKFPVNRRYLELFDVNVSNPVLTLQPEANRITTTMDASVAPPFLKQPWKGNMSISGNLKFDPVRNAIVLADPRIETFALDGLDGAYARQLGKLGGFLAEQLWQDAPLYTFKADDMRYGGTRFTPTKITTKSNSLVVTFEPEK